MYLTDWYIYQTKMKVIIFTPLWKKKRKSQLLNTIDAIKQDCPLKMLHELSKARLTDNPIGLTISCRYKRDRLLPWTKYKSEAGRPNFSIIWAQSALQKLNQRYRTKPRCSHRPPIGSHAKLMWDGVCPGCSSKIEHYSNRDAIVRLYGARVQSIPTSLPKPP